MSNRQAKILAFALATLARIGFAAAVWVGLFLLTAEGTVRYGFTF